MDRYARWNALLELLTETGRISVEDAADRLTVSQATIRRDFDQLAQQQMITRTRGGATFRNCIEDHHRRTYARSSGRTAAWRRAR